MTTLLDLSIPVFERGFGLQGQNHDNMDQLQKELLAEVNVFAEQANQAGYSASIIDDARYALLAWLDEYIYTETGLSFDWFAYSLVVKVFDDAAAGVTFYKKMDEQHRQADRLPLLQLYLRCLLMGFRGRYRLEKPDEFHAWIQGALSKMPSYKNPNLPCVNIPAGVLPKDRHGVGLLNIAALSLGIAVVVYFLLAVISAL